jgi:hypothetical protein
MYTRKIVSFISILLLSSTFCFGQDSLAWVRGIRVGCDLSRFGLYLVNQDRKALEFSGDTEIKRNLFGTIELGTESSTKQSNILSYTSSGAYARVGIDYNILKKDKMEKGRDLVFVGFRYGYSFMKQRTDSYIIPGPLDTVRSSYPSVNLSGHWVEAVFGLKVEVLRNLFLGASLRGRILLYSTKNINFPYYVPGYGKGGNKTNFGANYSIYYQIPLMKVKPKKVVAKSKGNM